MAKLHAGVVGAPGLLAKELAEALEERRFPAAAPRLLRSPLAPADGGARGWAEFDEEAVVLEPFAAEALEDLDVLFLAGTRAEARAAWNQAAQAVPLTVDLTGELAEAPEAQLSGLEPAREAGEAAERPRPGSGRLIVVAHPAAQALALLLGRLGLAGEMHAVATIFEPASQRGMAGIQELEQQARLALAMQPWPQAVFGVQVAHNLRARLGPEARPGLAEVRAGIAAQTEALLASADERRSAGVALCVVQAPIFHATLLSLYCRPTPPVAVAGLEALLTSAWIERTETPPDALAAAGRDEILVGPLEEDPAGGVWLFAALDNLRRTAFGAVDAAAAALRSDS